MPVSRSRARRRRPSGVRAVRHTRDGRGARKGRGWAWGLAIVGGIAFLLGNIGARVGWVFLPFDRHHVLTQFGGAGLAAAGLLLATRR